MFSYTHSIEDLKARASALRQAASSKEQYEGQRLEDLAAQFDVLVEQRLRLATRLGEAP